jgi:phosphatidate phosphatase PAH1
MRNELPLVRLSSSADGGSNGFGESLASGANDVVVVAQADGRLAATPVHLQTGKLPRFRRGKYFYACQNSLASS